MCSFSSTRLSHDAAAMFATSVVTALPIIATSDTVRMSSQNGPPARR